MMRIDKYLSSMGEGTRTEIKKFIKQGKVTINGEICKSPEDKVDGEGFEIALHGKIISYQQYEYYMLSKPVGCVTATKDAKDKTVMDYIQSKKKKELFPVGRLDKDTEGLLIITNDGELAHRLLSPKMHVDKVYYAIIKGIPAEKEVTLFQEGIFIGKDEKTMPAHLEILQTDLEKEEATITLTIQEGKFHQVKRMFEVIGCKVLYLKRLSMGTLVLDETLEPGQFRALTKEELRTLC